LNAALSETFRTGSLAQRNFRAKISQKALPELENRRNRELQKRFGIAGTGILGRSA